ncbi:class C sortase [Dorea sp. YH-dor226]|uniref:class C sortase n=1 Tax=Lachnospiraceae TaxID=186803 RepID=UPI001F2ADC4C|nr:class C sortase [Faecalicatena contorta]MCF2683071.1 class C sortase [Faecalicatena contorta]
MKWVKKNISTIILVLIFFVGLSLLLYPTISDYWNSFHQSRAIATYAEAVAELDDEDYEKMWQEAEAYNQKLSYQPNRWNLTEEEEEEYNRILDVGGTGIMGYIEIPEIKVSLPIYHGTDEGVLQIAVGHIPGSSLPVGGIGTHSVVSGHRGLPSAKLFTNLDELDEGDVFMIRVLDETLTYEVDKISIVEPDDLTGLEIDPELDLCTLVTCTPYGVNSHRLLVRGHRIPNLEDDSIRVTADAMQVDRLIVASAIAVPILLILIIWVLVHYRKKKS